MSFSANVLTAAPAAEEPGVLFVAVLGISVVMIGLICIILLCMLMSFVCTRLFGKDESRPAIASDAPKAPALTPVRMPAAQRSELIAAITAAVAEELGTDVSAIRILSFRSVSAAHAPALIPNKNELVAALAAAVAEDLGTDISALRIHSIRQIG